MKKNRTRKTAPAKRKLSAGEQFLKELREMPYTNDRVGQAFVITHYRPPVKKEAENNPEHEE